MGQLVLQKGGQGPTDRHLAMHKSESGTETVAKMLGAHSIQYQMSSVTEMLSYADYILRLSYIIRIVFLPILYELITDGQQQLDMWVGKLG